MSPTQTTNPDLRIIIPVYRDNEALATCLTRLRKQKLLDQALVVFGEPDETGENLVAEAGAEWIQAPERGRAQQMNAGAEKTDGTILLFLHADTALPDNAAENIARAINQGFLGGAFSRRFNLPSLFLRLTCLMADSRSLMLGWFLGDQAIFCRRDIFQALGGFQEWDFFEDLDFSRRMRHRGRTILLRPGVLSSGRRFARHGPIAQTWQDTRMTLRYLRKGDHYSQ